MTLMNRLFEYKTWQLFFTICAVMLGITFIMQYRLLDIDVFTNLIGNQLSTDQIDDMFESQLKYQWIGYVAAPLVLLLKTTFAAFFIHMILIFSDYEITFKDVFKLNLIAGSVFLLLSIVQAIIIYMVELESISTETMQSGSVSLASLADQESVAIPLYALLGVINPYEILYVIVTILGIKHLTKESTKKSSLVTGIIWGIFTTFIVVLQSFIQLTMQ